MDFSLLISAQPLVLAPNLRRTAPADGMLVLKNVPAKTYLRVTVAQWEILRLFEEPHIVPTVLDRAIRERLCPRLGEFYELILKAERARVLLRPEEKLETVHASDWHGAAPAQHLGRPLAALFLVGVVLAFAFRPELPATVLDAAAGLAILTVAYSLAAYVTGCLLHGSGGFVYRPRWRWLPLPPRFTVDPIDAVMLPRAQQDVICLVTPAMLAASAGITTWNHPAWSFFPLLGLIVNLRPALGGRFPAVLRVGREQEPSDAEQGFLFPPNRTPRARLRALSRGLRQMNTWVRLAYAVIWTLAVVYLAARLTDTPPWTPAFWAAHGVRVAIALFGSLALLAVGYLAWELALLVRGRWRTWFHAFRQWRSRWFAAQRLPLDHPQRIEAIANSPLLRSLDPTQRGLLAQSMEPARYGPWRALSAHEGDSATRMALIVSGKISVRRDASGTRRKLVQVLGPGDVVGLHEVADPNRGHYRLRTMTPVTLLTADRAHTSELILGRVTRAPFGNMVLKVPFLRSIALCRNWHLQAIERFAQLSNLYEYQEGAVIIAEGQVVDRFFIVFEGDAVVARQGRQIGVVRTGEFFGEIGLLQNSSASATITARRNARCLAIARTEFLRFVTHNYSVALELERVSSERLGRPIFPVHQSDFREL